ncbi:hypothetical protein G3580_18085 [Nitrogeniibacter mangrovi]|uniref:Lipoprotein n=1 Tax=Nitrogeniibacter mangrovi TaxID=2016596 RepID=A0A6C1B947_9RHOO|nr:hypothetical protein [Nitrogeniibacter mangrovi]QID19355.1 hypothetical protein G3580_18085 [Nitrogeniibacter mangrovi]
MMPRFAAGLALALTLAGCAATPTPPRSAAARTDGLAVLSLTVAAPAGTRVSRFEYRLRPVAQPPMNQARVERYYRSEREHARALGTRTTATGAPADRPLPVVGQGAGDAGAIREDSGTVGRVAVLRLAPGTYELRDWRLVLADRHGKLALTPPHPVVYRFTVPADGGSYLGNVHLAVTANHQYRFALADRRARDLALAGGTDTALAYRPGQLTP